MSAVNWPGLMAWSLKYHDGTSDKSEFKPLADDDRKFLEQAMQDAFGMIEDPNKIMLEACNQIKAKDRTDVSIITALEVIDRCCDDPDVARNAEKLDGIQPMIDLVKSHSGQIQSRSLEILALLFSNNPVLQEVGMKRGALGTFLEQIRSSPAGSEARGKSFRALAALIRKNKPFEEQFLKEHNGFEILLLCMGTLETAQSREKASTFLTSLLDDTELSAAELQQLGAAVLSLLASPVLSEENIQYKESIAECVLQLSKPLVKASASSVVVAALEAACKQRAVLCEQEAKANGGYSNGGGVEEVQPELSTIKEAYKVFLTKGK